MNANVSRPFSPPGPHHYRTTTAPYHYRTTTAPYHYRTTTAPPRTATADSRTPPQPIALLVPVLLIPRTVRRATEGATARATATVAAGKQTPSHPSLVAQRLDRIESGRVPRGVEPGEDADEHPHGDGDAEPLQRELERKVE